LLFQLFLGTGLAAVMPSLPTLVASWFPHEKAGLALGASISGYAVGDVIALSMTPYFLRLLDSWRSVFYVYGAWTMILTAIWWFAAKKPSQDSGKQQCREVRIASLPICYLVPKLLAIFEKSIGLFRLHLRSLTKGELGA